MKEYKDIVTFRFPIGVIMKIDEFQNKYKIKDRTAATLQLLDVAFTLESKMGQVEKWTNQDMEEIKSQLNQGTLVDWIQNMDPKKLEIVAEIFNVEKEARQRQKKIDRF